MKANVILKDAKDWLECIDEHWKSGTDFTTSHSKKDTSYGYSSLDQLVHGVSKLLMAIDYIQYTVAVVRSSKVAFKSSNLHGTARMWSISHACIPVERFIRLEAQNHALINLLL